MIKAGKDRDRVVLAHKVIGFEMEGAEAELKALL